MDRVRRIELMVRSAEAGSFTKAARLLGLDPSAVSHAIAELEKELRLTLFYRTTRQLKLTEDGEEMYRRGAEILHQLADLEGAASKAPEALTGILRVGMSVTMSKAIIMPRLSKFIRRHPNLRHRRVRARSERKAIEQRERRACDFSSIIFLDGLCWMCAVRCIPIDATRRRLAV